MIDPRLVRADATKLDELRVILSEQENSEILRPIEMKNIFIGHGAVKNVCEAVKSLVPGLCSGSFYRLLYIIGSKHSENYRNI